MQCPIVRHWRLIPPARYSALWCLYVNGARLEYHCQKSLIGIRSRKFSKGAKHGYADKPPILLDETANYPFAYYICGVSEPYRWDYNFHLAFKFAPQSTCEVKTPREHFALEHAERINIDALESYIDKSDPNYGNTEFRTCRNWIFANYVQRCLDEEKQKEHGLLPGLLE